MNLCLVMCCRLSAAFAVFYLLTNHESVFQLQGTDVWLHDGETIAKVFNKQPSAILSVSESRELIYHLNRYHVTNRMAFIAAL